MKKITLAAVILCVLLLFSCNNEEAGIGGESDMATDAAASEYIVLAEKDGKSAVIIRPDEATENVIDAAVSLRRSLESRYGISLTLQTDWLATGQSPAEDAVEIVVGFTNRSGDIESDLSARTFRITTKGSRVFVYGSSDIMTKNAVAYLLGKESPLIFEDGVLKIPADTDIVVSLEPKAGGTPKTILIVVDGLRPDALAACGNKFVDELLSHSIYTLDAKTVMPSVTLPSHMSLFHSVPPERHGILTNTYVPMVRPINGICEVLRAAGKASALFYDWEELKDLSRPDSLAYANYVSGHIYGYEKANVLITNAAIAYINEFAPDFTFLYLGETDAVGHGSGWMGPEYLDAVSRSIGCIENLIEMVSDDYCVIVTADHGGHDRSHGSDLPEDMTIPLIFYNSRFSGTKLQAKANIIDIAPTITAILDVSPDADWEGKVLDEVVEALK